MNGKENNHHISTKKNLLMHQTQYHKLNLSTHPSSTASSGASLSSLRTGSSPISEPILHWFTNYKPWLFRVPAKNFYPDKTNSNPKFQLSKEALVGLKCNHFNNKHQLFCPKFKKLKLLKIQIYSQIITQYNWAQSLFLK